MFVDARAEEVVSGHSSSLERSRRLIDVEIKIEITAGNEIKIEAEFKISPRQRVE